MSGERTLERMTQLLRETLSEQKKQTSLREKRAAEKAGKKLGEMAVEEKGSDTRPAKSEKDAMQQLARILAN